MIEAACRLTGIDCYPVPPDDPLLDGAEAVLVPGASSIFYKNSVDPATASFYQAHEFGHHWLGTAGSPCASAEIDAQMPEERMPLGIQRVEGYGPRERCECQANVFAREFLLPTSEARRLYVEDGLSAEAIGLALNLPLPLVFQQLARGVLIGEVPMATGGTHGIPPLDESQRVAAEVETGPLLLEAGPGTGKTRTLIARIQFLLRRGVDPATILALTYSNKAAEELRERVARAAPEAAAAIWTGTFHSFGLEILRKYGTLLGLPPDVRLVDPSDALLLLENALPSLPLDHYLQLYEPAFALKDILGAISRAKDELVDPATYLDLSRQMQAAADPEKNLAAEKAIEVAHVYAAYEQLLRSERVVDFADLINKAIVVMAQNDPVRAAVRQQFRHVLVDEYQDVNRASALLLQQVAGDGANLWVVGDARQSIYRFRGASPSNIRRFEQDFPGAQRLALATNYRSQAPIVRLVEAFAPTMRASKGGLPAQWVADRGASGGGVLMEVATDLPAEAAGIAREIKRHHAGGIPYRNQAVLCRSHTNLARVAALLEVQGVPVLYLGDLFERPEIRDLLALLSLTCESERGGLLRVASFPEYAVPLPDIQRVLAFARDKQIEPMAALGRLDEITGLGIGHAGLRQLAEHLRGLTARTTPGALLATYLFTRSRYLKAHCADNSVIAQQRRLAIYQFLQFVFEQAPTGADDPKRHLLRWVRRLELFGEERQLRQMPAAANGIDAVRLLTVHASKGLEFPIVFLPALGERMFPAQRQWSQCPPPAGMLHDDPDESHAEEEECLFFVALSRAQDVLCLSRAQTYPLTQSPSRLLTAIAGYLPRSPHAAASWHLPGPIIGEGVPAMAIGAPPPVHFAEDLDQYLKCPRQYLYQRLLALSGGREDNAYVRFHRSVYAVLRWMTDQPMGSAISAEGAIRELDAAWRQIGPGDHPYAALYWRAAEGIVRNAVARHQVAPSAGTQNWDIRRPGGTIRVRPDQVEDSPHGVMVRRLRTGRAPKKVDDDLYALYQTGASHAYPGKAVQVEVVYLSSDRAVSADMKPKMLANRLQKYDDALVGIASGLFPAKPNERTCPRCPQYFICPSMPSILKIDSEESA
jgi:superfamily I DNA/RNA helicase